MNWIKTPNIPTSAVSTVLVDYRTNEKIIKNLNKLGIKTILSCKNKNISKPVCGHADMMICHLGSNSFVCSPDSYDYFTDIFEATGINLIRGNSALSRTYPYDTAYNVAIIGDKVICAEQFADSNILNYCEANNFTVVTVRQGYAKCNTCVVNNRAIITSDAGIAKSASVNGIDVLLISQGHIRLSGYEYGFIGGATGLISGNTLAVCGTLKYHPDYAAIQEFCCANSVKLLDLSDEPATDIGSILPLSY